MSWERKESECSELGERGESELGERRSEWVERGKFSERKYWGERGSMERGERGE